MTDAGIKVSIIIPVYNGAEFMRDAIDSALMQTYKNTEIIVVNDGSDDDGKTEEIALSYGEKIRYFYKENGGVASALNLGIENMTGEWFSWLSHDDVYYPEKIRYGVEMITKYRNSLDKFVVLNRSELINGKGEKIKRPLRSIGSGVQTPFMAYKRLASRSNINGCALLVPKKAFDEVGGFNEKFEYIQDADCWIRLILSGYSFCILNRVLTKTRLHYNQVQKKIPGVYYSENEVMGMSVCEKVFSEKSKASYIVPLLEASIIQKNDAVAYEIISRLKDSKNYTLWVMFSVAVAKVKRIFTTIIRKILNQMVDRRL